MKWTETSRWSPASVGLPNFTGGFAHAASAGSLTELPQEQASIRIPPRIAPRANLTFTEYRFLCLPLQRFPQAGLRECGGGKVRVHDNAGNTAEPRSASRSAAGYDTELVIAGIVSIALGVLIFIAPRLLNYIVAAYLVVIGVIWLIAGL